MPIADVSAITAGVTLSEVNGGHVCAWPPFTSLSVTVGYRTATSSRSAAIAFAATARPSASPASASNR